MKVETHLSVFFAEAAEAVGVPTSDVLATWTDENRTIVVMFTRDREDDASPILEAKCERDIDNILRAVTDDVDTGLTSGQMCRRLGLG